MTKYQQYFEDMMRNHKELFDNFSQIHKKYTENPKKWQKDFNESGQEVLRKIRKYENMLCSRSEGGKYSKFSSNLAEKFWEPIRAKFPKIDYVGIILD